MQSAEGQQTTISQPGLGVLLMRGLILGLLVGFLVNLAFSYVILLIDKTSFLLIFQPVSNWRDIFNTIRRAAEFLVSGMLLSFLSGWIIVPAGILAGGLNGFLYRWTRTRPILQNLLGAIIGLGTGIYLAWSFFAPSSPAELFSKEDTALRLAILILGMLGGFLHSQFLERWR